MIETIEDIRTKLQNDAYKNEEHVRFSLVARILQKLEWDLWNPNEVFCEFPVAPDEDMSKVDIALFAYPYKPSVFIEIKAIGKLETNLQQIERQLRDYNRNNTAMFSIITDGRKWRFYYSQTAGEFYSKCFKVLDIIENDIDEIALSLDAFLSKSEILNGNAQRDAENYLQQSQIERAVTEALPKARRIVNEPPYPRLPKAIVQLVNQNGLIITEDEVIQIIENSGTIFITQITEKINSGTEIVTTSLNRNFTGKKIKEFVFLGKTYKPRSFTEMLVTISELLYKLHKDEFYKCTEIRGRTRQYFQTNNIGMK